MLGYDALSALGEEGSHRTGVFFGQFKLFLYTGTIYEYMNYDLRGRGMI